MPERPVGVSKLPLALWGSRQKEKRTRKYVHSRGLPALTTAHTRKDVFTHSLPVALEKYYYAIMLILTMGNVFCSLLFYFFYSSVFYFIVKKYVDLNPLNGFLGSRRAMKLVSSLKNLHLGQTRARGKLFVNSWFLVQWQQRRKAPQFRKMSKKKNQATRWGLETQIIVSWRKKNIWF